jgi:hypothetical protein
MSTGSKSSSVKRTRLDDLLDRLAVLSRKWEDNGRPNVRISVAEVVTDVNRMISAHVSMLRASSGKKVFMPYYERLQKLEKALEDSGVHARTDNQ